MFVTSSPSTDYARPRGTVAYRQAGVWIARLTLAACTLVWLPADAGAQQVTRTRENNVDFTQTDDSCHGPVQVVGKMHIAEATGPTSFRFKFHQLGEGVGLGVDNFDFRYQYQNWTDIYEESSARNFTSRFTIRKHVIRKGSPNLDEDDFFLVESIKVRVVAGIPAIMLEQSRFECK